ncbi:hypothetical protein EBB07_15455 [Paenibacillaceae bacterium]|nr:hypothetical protein EBB07_15455 [Paenibacillaceae bacterium]
MNNYIIKTIYIENFKLIDKFSLSLDLSKYNLIMLDGPNGFGKTTLFDAIELVLTGRIKRVRRDDARTTFGVDLLRKYVERDCIIKIEFCNGVDTSFTIMKRMQATKVPHRLRADDFFNFETFLLTDFNDTEEQYQILNQEKIENKFGDIDLSRFYNLFYYIQQDENTHFLKQKARERMDAIAMLFDTKQEEEEKQIISSLRSLIRQELTKTKTDIQAHRERFEALNLELTINGEMIQGPFYALFPHLVIPKLWDVEHPVINSRDSRDKMVKEIKILIDFLEHLDDFLNAKSNQEINAVIENRRFVEDVVLTALNLEKYDDIQARSHKEKKYKDIKVKLSRETFTTNPTLINIEDLDNDLDIKIDSVAISIIINQIVADQKKAGELSKLVRELNRTRDQLKTKFISLTSSHSHINNKMCPLCGYFWEDYNKLIQAIEERKTLFASYYDETTQKIETSFDELYSDHLNVVIYYLQHYLSDSKNIIDSDYFDRLTASNKKRQKIAAFIKWCESKDLNINKFIQKELIIPQNLDHIVNEFVEEIKLKKFKLHEDYDVGGEHFTTFSSIYSDYFNNTAEKAKVISKKQLEDKIKYLEMIYYTKNQLEYKELEADITKLENKKNLLTEKDTNLRRIVEEYDIAIKQHWNRIMKDIEIPFYIYSGKIIQYYQKGLGVFIKEADSGEAKTIRFVSNDISEHDAVNYFSSGQISALVISFTLALNKVYGNNYLGLILIDDPVQSMDEINMASLTELLRNEFPEKQIILSTHEDTVSRYIRYKFNKYGKSTFQFNVKRDLFVTS